MYVEVFRTNISHKRHADVVAHDIGAQMPGVVVNFDLDDCDKVLRVASAEMIDNDVVLALVKNLGFICEILPDEIYELNAMAS